MATAAYSWQATPLGEVLVERKEKPSLADLSSGTTQIVAKIGFDDGRIQLRSDTETRTGMILVRPGDLVVSGINAAKGAIAIYGDENKDPIAATIHYGAYIPHRDRVDVRFLWWLLRSQVFREILDTNLPGGIKTELKAKRLLPIKVPLPPIEEQHRIVSRVEELARKVEDARLLRAEVIKELCALVPAEVSRMISREQLNGKLGDVLLEKPRNGWSARSANDGTGVPVLSLGAITGFEYRPEQYKLTSEPTSPDAHYWLRKGDLLITRSNTPELVGHAAIYDGTPAHCIYPDLMMRLPINQELADVRFVHRWLMSRPVRDYIKARAKGTSPTMKKISQGVVMDIPFPSGLNLTVQRRIVDYLDDLQSKAAGLKKLQSATAVELEALMPSILAKAFRGEL